MGEWKHTSCVLCAQNCGLLCEIENNTIINVKGDRDNPRSEGYCCRKGLSIASYEHNADRLKYPLKKVGDHHERITWEQAIKEISEKLLKIRDEHGGQTIAYMGGGSVGGQMEVPIGLKFLNELGSRFYYSSLTQEFSNAYWVDARVTGKQVYPSMPDTHNSDTLVAWGWNGWMSNQEPQARTLILNVEKDPNKTFIVIDPRFSETAEHANIHLQLKAGSDTLLMKAMIRIILDNGWDDKAFIAEHVNGWEELEPLFDGFDARRAVTEGCGLDWDKTLEATRLIATTKSSIHPDLGIYMNRSSTLNNYLLHIIRCITGRFCVEGGQIIPAYLYALGGNTDERNPKVKRTPKYGMFPIYSVYPVVTLPDEILDDNPEHFRALIVSACNPMRSYSDTKKYKAAFEKLDLSVNINVAYDETARECDYVLPCKSYMENYDTVGFNYSFPELYFQLRQPVVEPISDECKEGSEIFVELFKACGLMPELSQSLYEAGRDGITAYGMEMMMFLQEHMELAKLLPVIMAETLGPVVGSYNKAIIVGLLVGAGKAVKLGANAMGYPDPDDPMFAETVFEDAMKHPEGMILAKFTCENFRMLKTEDKKLNLTIDELVEPLKAATIDNEMKILNTRYEEYPLLLSAGLHHETVINTILRNPEWNKGRDADSLWLSQKDAEELKVADGDRVRVTTKAGSVEMPVEIYKYAAEGTVYIRQGRGLIYDGKQYGININELTSSENRDELHNPVHRRAHCRVEKL